MMQSVPAVDFPDEYPIRAVLKALCDVAEATLASPGIGSAVAHRGAAAAAPRAASSGIADRVGLPLLPYRESSSDVAVADWDDLFCAVKARLELIVAAGGEKPVVANAAEIRIGVLDCVTALDQLHLTLMHELERRQQLELEVFDAQAALSEARAELTGSRAGTRHAE